MDKKTLRGKIGLKKAARGIGGQKKSKHLKNLTKLLDDLQGLLKKDFDPELSCQLDSVQLLLDTLGARSPDPCGSALTTSGAPSPSGGDNGSVTTTSPK